MFKVMCIKQGEWRDFYGDIANGPRYGETCTVDRLNSQKFYILKEWPRSHDGGHDPERFIPLSSIDETEMVREKQTEKVCAVALK